MTKKNENIPLNQIPAVSKDVRKEMLDKMRKIYPALFGEGNTLNAKELQALVDDYSKPEVERFAFPWTGKTASKRFAFTPSRARLVPDKDRSVDFDTTQNLIIEGENLEVLKLLQSSYFKKVKMIYIDPPYNTGHDFVYPDDYSESKQAYWEKGGVLQEGVRVDTNTESSGRYHSNWLSMMQSRLLLARNLLRDDGVIFVSIDDNEVHNLRKLMDEIFGEENFVASIIWQKKFSPQNDEKFISPLHDYIIVYAKIKEAWHPSLFLREGTALDRYSNPDNDPRGPWSSGDLTSKTKAAGHSYPITSPEGIEFYPQSGRQWAPALETFKQMLSEGRIWFGADGTSYPRRKQYLSEVQQGIVPSTWWDHEFAGHNQEAKQELKKLFNGVDIGFETPKPVKLLKRLTQLSGATNGDYIFDFFAGSGTTAQAVAELNKEDHSDRKFILVQIPEATNEKSEAFKAGYKTISQITVERVRRAGEEMKEEYSGEMGTYNGIIDLGVGKKNEMEIPFLPDVGFKTFYLTTSLFPQNMFEVNSEMSEEEKVKAWGAYLEKSKQAHLFDFKPDELLLEIALKDGFDLNFQAVTMKEFKKNKVLDVSDGEKSALVCLDESIHDETIKALETFKERRFICLERSVDSTRKWNLKRMFGDNLWVA